MDVAIGFIVDSLEALMLVLLPFFKAFAPPFYAPFGELRAGELRFIYFQLKSREIKNYKTFHSPRSPISIENFKLVRKSLTN